MTLIHFQAERCPGCRMPFDVHVMGLCTGLGPPEILCRKCGECVRTGRSEWPLATTRARLVFYIVTLVYLVLGALIGGNSLYGAAEYFNGNAHPKNLPLEDPRFIPFMWVGAGIVLLFQIIRVSESIRRKETAGLTVPPRMGFFTPDLTLAAQLKTLLFFLLPAFAGWIKLRL